MNNPFMTQTQIERRHAARLDSPRRLRRALRLDNPQMWGERMAPRQAFEADELPTPLYVTAGGSILDPQLFPTRRASLTESVEAPHYAA